MIHPFSSNRVLYTFGRWLSPIFCFLIITDKSFCKFYNHVTCSLVWSKSGSMIEGQCVRWPMILRYDLVLGSTIDLFCSADHGSRFCWSTNRRISCKVTWLIVIMFFAPMDNDFMITGLSLPTCTFVNITLLKLSFFLQASMWIEVKMLLEAI